jgi:hypothetical protein
VKGERSAGGGRGGREGELKERRSTDTGEKMTSMEADSDTRESIRSGVILSYIEYIMYFSFIDTVLL